MATFTDMLVLIGMFALRIGVPVAVIALLVYFLKRLDQRWENEARGQMAGEKPAQPVRQVTRPQPVIRPAVARPAGLVSAAGQPCWETNGCSEGMKASCPAYKHPEQACWQARLQVEGKIPEKCTACQVFQRYPTM